MPPSGPKPDIYPVQGRREVGGRAALGALVLALLCGCRAQARYLGQMGPMDHSLPRHLLSLPGHRSGDCVGQWVRIPGAGTYAVLQELGEDAQLAQRILCSALTAADLAELLRRHPHPARSPAPARPGADLPPGREVLLGELVGFHRDGDGRGQSARVLATSQGVALAVAEAGPDERRPCRPGSLVAGRRRGGGWIPLGTVLHDDGDLLWLSTEPQPGSVCSLELSFRCDGEEIYGDSGLLSTRRDQDDRHDLFYALGAWIAAHGIIDGGAARVFLARDATLPPELALRTTLTSRDVMGRIRFCRAAQRVIGRAAAGTTKLRVIIEFD